MAAATREPVVYYIGIVRRKDPSLLADTPTIELSKQFWEKALPRFIGGSFKQAMTFTAQTVAERTGPGIRQEVVENNSRCFAFGRGDGICGILIANVDYPRLPAHNFLSKVVTEFASFVPRASYVDVRSPPKNPNFVEWEKKLENFLVEAQTPAEADSITKAQMELDETKILMHKTIESVLERGEKIDSLVAKSDGLSASSKMFYQSAKKQNSCCIVM